VSQRNCAVQVKRLTRKDSTGEKLYPYPLNRPAGNKGAEELFNVLPLVHQRPDQQLSLNKCKILTGQLQQGRKHNPAATATTTQAMCEWVPSADRVSGITEQSAYSYSVGCIAGTWFSPAQCFTLRNHIASHPCWIATSVAGRFFQDHFMQAFRKPHEKAKFTPAWIKAKKEAYDLTGSKWTHEYSDNEASTLTNVEKASRWPSNTYWCATPTAPPVTAQACTTKPRSTPPPRGWRVSL
jgi:hypothetical protein